jgi:hypothetical protein
MLMEGHPNSDGFDAVSGGTSIVGSCRLGSFFGGFPLFVPALLNLGEVEMYKYGLLSPS